MSSPNNWEHVVSILVGPERKKFTIHKDRLEAHTGLFSGPLRSAFEGAVSGEVELPEQDTQAFSMFAKWTYDNIIEYDPLSHPDWLKPLGEAWLLAQYLKAPQFANAVMDIIISSWVTVDREHTDQDNGPDFNMDAIPGTSLETFISITARASQYASISNFIRLLCVSRLKLPSINSTHDLSNAERDFLLAWASCVSSYWNNGIQKHDLIHFWKGVEDFFHRPLNVNAQESPRNEVTSDQSTDVIACAQDSSLHGTPQT